MASRSKPRSSSNAPVLPPLTFSSFHISTTTTSTTSLSHSQPSDPFTSSSSSSSMIFNHAQPSSPTRVNLQSRSTFSISLTRENVAVPKRPYVATAKRTCMCSPTSHPGSFRCALHRNAKNNSNSSNSSSISCSPSRLNLRRSAMTNSLVRIGTVEGDWVRRALTALIRPSSHQQRRRCGFHPRPSRLSVMSTS